MPTMQEIDQIEVEIQSCQNPLFAIHPELALALCAAARRGVEGTVQPCCQQWDTCEQQCVPLSRHWKERAEKAEIDAQACREQIDDMLKEIMATRAALAEAVRREEVAAIQSAQPEYPSTADDEATRWRHGEPVAQLSDERIAQIYADETGLDLHKEPAALLDFARALLRKAQPEGTFALNVKHPDCHRAADAFWQYWRENGETHKHGYYESTWGGINAAIRLVGVIPYQYAAPKGTR